MEDRQAYDSDLSDAEWDRLEPLVPPAKPGGRPPKHTRREIVNGICYAIRSGGAWKLLPHDLPPWRTVYHYFWSWRRQGIWSQIHDTLRQWVRQAAGREVGNPANRGRGATQPSVRCSTTSQCEPVSKEVRVAMMGPRNCVGASATSWWIRWDWLLVVMTKADVQDRDGRAGCCRFWLPSSGDCG